METSMKCIKYLLFLFNLFFAISGLALIVVGGVIQGMYSEYLDFLGHQFFNVPVLLVVVGCIIFAITFFGCCGAIKENYCMVMTFAVLLAVIFIIELGAGIAAYVLRNEVRVIVDKNMEKGLTNYGKPSYEGVTNTWDVLQHELKCCGVGNYTSWENTTFSGPNGSVPDSCCQQDTPGCGVGVLKLSDEEIKAAIHTNGCLPSFEKLLEKNIAIVGGLAVAIALVQVIGIIFACCLAKSIRAEYQSV